MDSLSHSHMYGCLQAFVTTHCYFGSCGHIKLHLYYAHKCLICIMLNIYTKYLRYPSIYFTFSKQVFVIFQFTDNYLIHLLSRSFKSTYNDVKFVLINRPKDTTMTFIVISEKKRRDDISNLIQYLQVSSN